MLRFRILYFVFFSGTVLFYLLVPDYLSFLLMTVAFLLPVALFCCLLAARRGLSVTLQGAPTPAGRKEALLFCLTVNCASLFPVSRAKITVQIQSSPENLSVTEDFVIPCFPRQSRTLNLPVFSSHYGKISLTVTELSLYDPLCLFKCRRCPELSAFSFVFPAPEPLCLSVNPFVSADASSFSKAKSGDDPSEVFGIREYRPGDRIRSIHWKLSSKREQLLVREFSLPENRFVLLLVETGIPEAADFPSPAAARDTLLKAAASLSAQLCKDRIAHSFLWFDSLEASLSRFDAAKEEDVGAFLPLLLSSGFSKENAPSLSGYLKTANPPYPAHIVYLTASLTQKSTELLLSLACCPRISLLYAAGKETPSPLPEECLKRCSNAGLYTVCFTEKSLSGQLDGLVL